MPIVTPLNAAIQAVLAVAGYTIAHEMLHYIPARLLGYQAELSLKRGPLLASPAVSVNDDVRGVDKLLILYMPYLLNILLLLVPNPVTRAVGIITMPNALLEDEESRQRMGVAAVAAAYAVAALTVAALG